MCENPSFKKIRTIPINLIQLRYFDACSGVDQKLVICTHITNIVINKCKQINASLRSGMMQLETCTHINSQGSTDNLKLISIHSKQFEVCQLSSKRNSQLTNYQLTNVKLKQCLGCSFWGRKYLLQ